MQTIARELRPPARRHTLDSLMTYDYDELARMYNAASATQPPVGVLAGRMLAWRGARGVVAGVLRRIALSPAFVWEGKTFTAGGGFNRVQLRGVLGRQALFPFASRLAPSLFDGKPTIVIDYDRADNPPWMRRVHDEIRELEPGLFLGLDLWRTRDRDRSTGLVWFALHAP